jgi:hypothetical protein
MSVGLAVSWQNRQAQSAQAARSLRRLYLSRVVFSALWVAVVSSTSGGSISRAVVGGLLALYPASDVVATVLDIRAGRVVSSVAPQYLNLAAGVGATVGVVVRMFVSLAAGIEVFAAWAVVSGLIQLVVAVLRRRVLTGQWPMIVSGAGSVFAGISFLGWTGSPRPGLSALAQYSAGGAVWYLLTALWLTWSVALAQTDDVAGRVAS